MATNNNNNSKVFMIKEMVLLGLVSMASPMCSRINFILTTFNLISSSSSNCSNRWVVVVTL